MIETKYSDAKRDAEFNQAVGDFVSQITFGEPGRIKDFASLAVLDNNSLIAGVLYHNFYPENGVVEMSAASLDRRWLTRPVLREMFGTAFERFGCQLVALRVSENNAPMLRIARSFGFSEHIIPRLRGRDEAEHILTFTDDAWTASRFRR